MKAKDNKYIWHPFSAFPDREVIPVESGSGVWLHTTDGRRIMDAVSSWWVNLFGHGNEYIANAVAEQARKLEHVIFAGFTHAPAVNLAERLIGLLPEYAKVYYSDNGSTAVEVAMKLAIHYWFNTGKPKKKIVALEGAYHGDTFGAMSAGGRSIFSQPFNDFLFEVTFVPLPDDSNIEQSKKALEDICSTGDVAAFIFEPLVQGTAGMRFYKPEYLDELLGIANKYEVLTIADEVFTGFGRTGRNFACDYLVNKPDLICLSKGITGGFLPLGVTICNEKIQDAFIDKEKFKSFFHGHSYTANAIACAAANASLDLLLSPESVNSIRMIVACQRNFADKHTSNSVIDRIESFGTILTIEFKTDASSGYMSTMRDYLYNFFLDRNILIRPLGNVIYLVPPYIITEQELSVIYHAIESLFITLENNLMK